jgi:ribosomal protein L24
MTYGEASVAEQDSMTLVNGVWVQTVHIKNKPKPMSKPEAIKYYNIKLFAYWMDKLDDRLSIHRKKQLISAFMFGHTDRYKNFKELK